MALPEGWLKTTLGECQRKPRAINPSAYPNEQFDLYSVPSYSNYAPDVVIGAEIGSQKQEVQEGDILLCKIVPHIRRSWAVPTRSKNRQIASGEWIVLRDHGLEVEFLRRFLLSDNFHEQFMQTVSGVGGSLMRARPADAARITVPIPPAAEQRRIVLKLDALGTRLTRAQLEINRVFVLAQRLQSLLLSELFGSAIQHSWPRLGDVLDGIEAGKNLKCEERPPKSHELGIVKVSAVSSESFKPEESKTLPTHYVPQERERIQDGDLLIARASGSINLVGRVALVRKPPPNLYLSDKILRLRAKQGLADWVHWFLRSPIGRSQIEDAATGISMHNITQDSLRAIKLPVPAESFRRDAIENLSSALTRIHRIRAMAQRLSALLSRLEAGILTKAFQGELVAHNADEGSFRSLS